MRVRLSSERDSRRRRKSCAEVALEMSAESWRATESLVALRTNMPLMDFSTGPKSTEPPSSVGTSSPGTEPRRPPINCIMKGATYTDSTPFLPAYFSYRSRPVCADALNSAKRIANNNMPHSINLFATLALRQKERDCATFCLSRQEDA